MSKQEYRRWTEQEVQYLQENYESGSMQAMAEHLGRTIWTVHKKANMLGLHRSRNSTWTSKQETLLVKIIADNFTNMNEGFRIAQKKLKKSVSKCQGHWYSMKNSGRLQEILSELHYEATFMAMNKNFKVLNTKVCGKNSVLVERHTLWSKIKELFHLS